MLTSENLTNAPAEAGLASVRRVEPLLFDLSRISRGWPLAVGALVTCWLFLFNELKGEWDINPQYNYGYVVPLLGALLFWRRWPERPAVAPGKSLLINCIGFGFLLTLLPLEVVREANPEWRLLYWLHGFIVLGLSFCLLHRAGSWGWVRYFAWPLIFMLIAVPWPMDLEQAVIQALMRFVAGLTIAVAGWLGIPAIQHGNLIEISGGVVGVNEACSGVRSLQSALMLSLCFGEMYRFSTARRLILIGASLIFVLMANVARTSFLTWAAANCGMHQMEAWHDTAGLIVMAIVLPGLFGLAHLLRPVAPAPSVRLPPVSLALPPIRRWIAVTVFVWIGISMIATEVWYRSHEKNLVVNPPWTVAWPVEDPHFAKTAVPEESLAILRCSTSDSAKWKDEADNQWNAFFLRWNAGKNSAQLATVHRPDICFPAAGASLVEDYGPLMATANGLTLPFKYLTFQSGDHLLNVFYCLWSDRESAHANPMAKMDQRSRRLQAVLAGERNLGQQVLEVVIVGPETTNDAVSLFEQQLPRLIRRE